MFLTLKSYVSFSSNVSAYKSNLYIDHEINIIGLSTHVLDLGVSMSNNCTFYFHISNLYITFAMRDPQVMLTLF